MRTANGPLRTGTAKVEQIPVSWALPEHVTRERRLVIWLAPGLSGMEVVLPVLERRTCGPIGGSWSCPCGRAGVPWRASA